MNAIYTWNLKRRILGISLLFYASVCRSMIPSSHCLRLADVIVYTAVVTFPFEPKQIISMAFNYRQLAIFILFVGEGEVPENTLIMG